MGPFKEDNVCKVGEFLKHLSSADIETVWGINEGHKFNFLLFVIPPRSQYSFLIITNGAYLKVLITLVFW